VHRWLTKAGKTVFALLTAGTVLFLSACSQNYKKPVIIWTDKSEFASYAELFNASQDQCKVIVIYKESPAEAFPIPKDVQAPDIVIGPWLKNERVRKYFSPLDHLFNDLQLNKSIFYSQLLEIGNIDDKQYLLPVSFNLPAIIFSKKNQELIDESYILSLDQIKNISASYNEKNKSGVFTAMGFAPRWNPNFLYTAAKLKGANFKETGDSFSWNEQNLQRAISYLTEWTTSHNESTSTESDFAFKYLYTPAYKLISSNRCLFAYTSSNLLFNLPAEKIQDIEYRWLHENYSIPIEDKIISLGLYKKSKNTDAAELFILWLMKESSQKAILERQSKMNLSTATFGIADGFSSIKSVNERVFPVYYPILFRNLPVAEYVTSPNILPSRWESIKEKVIMPYLLAAVDTGAQEPEMTLQKRFSEWNKQYF